MAEPSDMILPVLREIRAEMNARFDGVDRRLAALEAGQVTFRRALQGDSLMGKLVTDELEERIEVLERRVQDLEAQR